MAASPDVLGSGFSVVGARQRWDLLDEIGRGGTSRVLAVVGEDGAQGALKLLSGHRFSIDGALERRHAREVEEMAALSDRNVLPVLDVIELGPAKAAVFELAVGTLDARLQAGEGIDTVRAITLLQEVASGLSAIHAAGLVHRDLSPKNLLMMADGRVCVSDLGAGRRPEYETVTRTDDHLGSLLYVSPQQAANVHSAVPADDVFSFGQIAYLVLTGQRPQGNPPQLSARRPELPARIISGVELMRSYRREQRPPDGTSAFEVLTMTPEDWLDTAVSLVEHRAFADAMSAAAVASATRLREHEQTVDSVIEHLDNALTQADLGWHPPDPTQYLRFATWVDTKHSSEYTKAMRRSAEVYWESELVAIEAPYELWARTRRRERRFFRVRQMQLFARDWESVQDLEEAWDAFRAIVGRVHEICLRHKLANSEAMEAHSFGLSLLAKPYVRAVLTCIEPLLVISWATEPQKLDEKVALLPSQWLQPFDWLDEALIILSSRLRDTRTFLRMLSLDPSGRTIRERWNAHIASSCHCDVVDVDFDARGVFVPVAREHPQCTYLRLVSVATDVANISDWYRLRRKHPELHTIEFAADSVPTALQLLAKSSE
jgi:serine/threonine protein kinase